MTAIRIEADGTYSVCDISYDAMAAELGGNVSGWEVFVRRADEHCSDDLADMPYLKNRVPDVIAVSALDDQHLPPNVLLSRLTLETWRGTVYLLREGYMGLTRSDVSILLEWLDDAD